MKSHEKGLLNVIFIKDTSLFEEKTRFTMKSPKKGLLAIPNPFINFQCFGEETSWLLGTTKAVGCALGIMMCEVWGRNFWWG